jgi:hypothetical protein
MKALSHRKQQKGAVLILVTVALFTLLGFTALALDGGYLLLNKTRVQDAVDSAALSGGKTLSDEKATHADAIQAVRDTMKAIMEGDGFKKMNVDTTKLAETVQIEFSHDPVPFSPSVDEDARYIRVRMETVPVTQFFSQLMVDVWQVRASAVAGTLAPEKGTQICDVVPLLMLVSQEDVGTPGYGYNMANAEQDGDFIVIKSPAAGNPNMAPGNFQALRLDDAKGADRYRDGLAGGHCIDIGEDYEVDECPENDNNCALTIVNGGESGNMAGPTRQGLNTRFNEYSPGKYKKPSYAPDDPSAGEDDFYSDCVLSSADLLDFSYKGGKLIEHLGDVFDDGSATKSEIIDALNQKKASGDLKNDEMKDVDDFISAASGMQMYADYQNPQSVSYKEYEVKGNDNGCLKDRRIVKVPVAVGGSDVGENIPVIGVACMFLNQQVTGNGLSQYVVGEFIPECGADGDGASDESGFTQPRLVLYNDSGSGDS